MASLRHLLVFLLKASRPGLWCTAAWFYLLPLGQRNIFHSNAFWVGLLYVTFPLGLLLYGLNDIGDQRTDALNPRKDSFLFGARGSEADLRHLPLAIGIIQAPFIYYFWRVFGVRALAWFLAAAVANALYNAEPLRLKNRPGWDLLSQAAYGLVFVLSSWLNGVPGLPWVSAIFGILFAMHSHLLGQILDLEPDRRAGRTTTAALLGRVQGKWLLAGWIAFEALYCGFVFHAWLFAAALACGSLLFLADALWGFRDRNYPAWLLVTFMMAINIIELLTMPWVWKSGFFLRA
jgi:4-hydroxybenzoate polyprenyltransferase